MTNKKKLRVATVFSGIGAAEEALRQLDMPYEIVFACDNGERHLQESFEQIMLQTKGMTSAQREVYVSRLYEATGKQNLVKQSYLANNNIGQAKWHEDVRFLDGRQYRGKVDLFVGGSPCQSFSTYGKKRGLEDTRGTLFHEYARLVMETRPKVFIFENVRGLLCHDKGRTWETIQEVFNSLKYDIHFRIMDARHYGLPQMRKRIFVVGTHRSLKVKSFNFPPEIPLTVKSTDLLEKKVPIEYYLPEKGFKWTTEVHRNKNKARINRDVIGCQTAVQQINWSGDFRLEKPRKEHYDSKYVYVGKYKGADAVVRKLMPKECLRLMGFSDFKIVVEDRVAYRQSGNSIAVPVIKALIQAICEQIKF